jgi:zinc protease
VNCVDRSKPPALGPLPAFRVPQPERFVLSNGLQVAFVARPGTGLADVALALRIGAIHDPSGLFGLADWTGSLLTEGAGSRNALEFADAADFLGARLDTRVSWDSITATLHIPVERLVQGLELLADALARPRFDAAEFDRLKAERQTAFIEARSEPGMLSHLAVLRAVFPESTRLHFAIEGTPTSLTKTTLAQVRRFHSMHFRPDAAVLSVAADLKREAVESAIARLFGEWPAPSSPAVAQALAPALTCAHRLVLVDKPGAPQSILTVAAPTPADLAPLDPATEVLNTVLGGAFTSRLNMNLREAHGYTYGARSTFEFWAGGGMFRAGAAVATPVTAPALAEILHELDGIRQRVEAEELQKARTYRAVNFPTNFETGRHTVDVFSWAAMLNVSDAHLQSFMTEVEAVDAQAVCEAAARTIVPDQMAIVIVGDRAQIEAPIEALKLGSLRMWDASEVID